MDRKLVAALACRAGGSRLYGKPLQNLGDDVTILEHILMAVQAVSEIEEAVLGVSEGLENLPFVEIGHRHGVGYIIGDETDVLWRLIQCGRSARATDVFRITTECPFTSWELLSDAWRVHVAEGNDITVTDFLPEGMNFEIYTLDALERSHAEGGDSDRSEFCSAYARRRPDRFRIKIIDVPESWRRLDLRLTVDYPEDLVLCRRIFDALKGAAPLIPTTAIIDFVDAHPELHSLVASYVMSEPVWAGVVAAGDE